MSDNKKLLTEAREWLRDKRAGRVRVDDWQLVARLVAALESERREFARHDSDLQPKKRQPRTDDGLTARAERADVAARTLPDV